MEKCCYNCHSRKHFSRDCDQPQNNSRCSVCGNVCASESSHRASCTNKAFRSAPKSKTTLFKSVEIVEMEFIDVAGRFVIDKSDDSKEVNITDVPLFCANTNLLIHQNDRNNLIIRSVCPSFENDINIIDECGISRLKLKFKDKYFEIDGRYRIEETGTVTFNVNNVSKMVEQQNAVNIKVNARNSFKVILYKYERFVIDVYSGGASLIDPLSEKLGK